METIEIAFVSFWYFTSYLLEAMAYEYPRRSNFNLQFMFGLFLALLVVIEKLPAKYMLVLATVFTLGPFVVGSLFAYRNGVGYLPKTTYPVLLYGAIALTLLLAIGYMVISALGTDSEIRSEVTLRHWFLGIYGTVFLVVTSIHLGFFMPYVLGSYNEYPVQHVAQQFAKFYLYFLIAILPAAIVGSVPQQIFGYRTRTVLIGIPILLCLYYIYVYAADTLTMIEQLIQELARNQQQKLFFP